MKKKWAAIAAIALAAASIGVGSASASADVVNNGTLFTDPGYDYGASIIQTGSVRQYWWCSPDTVAGGYYTDTIKYRTYNTSTHVYSAIQTVLAPSPGGTTWDKSYICDPSVIKGSFSNAGTTYTYALYYTATDRGPGSSYAGGPLDGTNNRIGVAFSNDGVTWVKYANNPVLYPQSYPTDNYGLGQASTYSSNGVSNLKVFFHDDSVSTGSGDWERDTTNGTTFTAPVAISGAGVNADGTAGKGYNPDIAYDQYDQNWYAIWPLAQRGGDRETYHAVLARMSASTFPSGTWQRLTDVDTNLTGDYLVNNPALVRDQWGNVDPTLPSVEVVYAGGTNDPGTWDLKSVVWTPPTTNRALNRYYNSSTQFHLVTTGYVPSGFVKESTIGYLSWTPTAGAVPLYGCVAGANDYFVSPSSICEGQTPNGNNGYIWTSAPAGGSVQIYRCYTGHDHFVSTSSTCEGQHVDMSLGYVKTAP